MSKKSYNLCKGCLIEFSYIFKPTEKHYGLICDIISDYNFEKILYVLRGKSLETIPISIVYIIKKYE